MKAEAYENDIQYLCDEFSRIKLRLQLILAEFPAAGLPLAPDFPGICREDAPSGPHRYAQTSAGPGGPEDNGIHTGIQEITETLSRLTEQVARRKKATLRKGNMLALSRLTEVFGINEFETEILMLCLATEIEQPYS